jgi:hypothetical protein
MKLFLTPLIIIFLHNDILCMIYQSDIVFVRRNSFDLKSGRGFTNTFCDTLLQTEPWLTSSSLLPRFVGFMELPEILLQDRVEMNLVK